MPLARPLALCAGLLLLAIGLVVRPMDWTMLAPRMLDTGAVLAIAALLGAVAAPLLRLPRAAAILLLGLGLPALLFAGWAALLAALLLALGGLAVASLLPADGEGSPLPRWIAGLGLLAAAGGWLLPFPVHHALAWGAALLGLVAWRRAAVRADLSRLRHDLTDACREHPALTTLAALVLVAAAMPAWLPSSQQDDLTYHLGLGWQLLEYRHALLNVGSQSWAMAPWSTDVPHALAMLLSGGEARGPVNVLWMLAAGLLVRALGQRFGLSGGGAWIAAMLYASLPFVAGQAMGQHVESATPALFAALSLLLSDPTPATAARLKQVAVLAGFLLGAKSSNGLLLLPFLGWMAWAWRTGFPWRALPASLALGVFTGASSYVYCGLLTGNPVLPLFNQVFHSPWVPPQALYDTKWLASLGWDLPWRLVFDTASWASLKPGGAGVFWLALLGGVPLALVDRGLRAPLLVALSAMLSLLAIEPHLRYVQPLSALLVPVLAAALLTPGGARWRDAALLAVVVLQLALQGAGNWLLQANGLRLLVHGGPEAVHARILPERRLSQRFRELAAPESRLLFADRPRNYSAELPGRAMGLNWHNASLFTLRARAGDDADGWAQVLDRAGASHLILRQPSLPPGLAGLLEKRGAVRVAGVGQAALYALPPRFDVLPGAMSKGEAWSGLTLDGDTARVGRMELLLDCRAPGGRVRVDWTYAPEGRAPRTLSQTVDCGADGRAVAALSLAVPAVPAQLDARARPAPGSGGMDLQLEMARAELREDALAGGQLHAKVWDTLCPAGLSWCRAPDVKLQPLP